MPRPRYQDVPALGYCRISKDDMQRGHGVERQRADVEAAARDEGLRLVDVLVDNDVSASRYARNPETGRVERPGWSEVVRRLEAGEATALVAYHLDRTTRDMRDAEDLIDLGVVIYAEWDRYDLRTGSGRSNLRRAIERAAHEADRISERTKRAHAQRARRGRPHWARRPFGYTRGGEPEPDEAATIRRMFAALIAGRSCSAIARDLNAAGIRTTSGKLWQAAAVAATLSSPRTAGLREHRGRIVGEGAWPGILTPDERGQAIAALAALSTGPRALGRRHALSGLVRCTCGAPRPMARAAVKRGAQHVWRCLARPDGGCGRSIAADPLERFVAAATWEALRRVELERRTVEPEPNAGPSVAELEAEERSLAELYGAGSLTLEAFTVAAQGLRDRLEAARVREATRRGHGPLGALVAAVDGWPEAWAGMDGDARRAVFAAAIEAVRVERGEPGKAKAGGELERIAARVEILWRI